MSNISELETVQKTITTTTGELLPAAGKRDYLHIQNEGANDVYIRFGDSAAALDATSIKIASGGGVFSCEAPGVGAIQAISQTASVNVAVTTNKAALS